MSSEKWWPFCLGLNVLNTGMKPWLTELILGNLKIYVHLLSFLDTKMAQFA